MKKDIRFLILVSFLTLFTLPGHSQDTSYARAIIKKLASAEFRGRGYVENGDKICADYISAEYQKAGLNPVKSKSYFQKFNISVNTFPSTISVKLNNTELLTGADFIIEASSPSLKGKFSIIKTSRSQLTREENTVDLVRKSGSSFILIDSRDKKSEKPEITKRVDEYINFLKYAPEINIKGIIIFTSEKLTWEASQNQGSRPIIILKKDVDLDTLNTIELEIDAKFLANYETQNVIGSIKGTADSDSMIVVTAHYDHLGKMGKDTYFPGANDNASGVAMILNLARYYSVNKPKYTTIFIALSAEELGLIGAKVFTENPPVDLKKIKFLINFDLAGTGDEGIKVVNGSIFRDKYDLLTRINAEDKLLPKVEIRGAACNSDHCPFYQSGVPCFYIYTLGGIQAYHDIYDKYETLPLTEFSDYCKLITEFLKGI